MKEIRIGNTFIVLWTIRVQDPATKEVVDYNLEGKHLELYYISQCGERSRAEDFTVESNTVIWKFQGSHQKDLGVYTIVLVENEDGQEQRICNWRRKYRWKWAGDDKAVQLPVLIHQQLLAYFSKPNNVLTGTMVTEDDLPSTACGDGAMRLTCC